MAHQSSNTEYQVRINGKPVNWDHMVGQDLIDAWLKHCVDNPDAYVDIVAVRTEILVNQGNYDRMKKHFQSVPTSQCTCHACIKEFDLKGDFDLPLSSSRMILCPECGNKRCPRASNHRNNCTNSNEPNQTGSVY